MALTLTTNGNARKISTGSAAISVVGARVSWQTIDDTLTLEVDESKFIEPRAGVTIDGNTFGTVEDLETALGTFFSSPGGGAIPGIDSVLAQNQQITATRTVGLNGKRVLIAGGNVGIDMDDGNNSIILFGPVGSVVGVINGSVFVAISEFANNAAALAGNVISGGLYFTTESGERYIKQAHD